MDAPLNLFELQAHPTAGLCDDRPPSLKVEFEKLSIKLLEIFGGDMSAARAFVERTVLQMRCSFGPCKFCGRMTRASLMCVACQRVVVLGAGVNAPPNKNKQMSYFIQFAPQILKRAKDHKQRCFLATQLKKIQAVARGWLVRH